MGLRGWGFKEVLEMNQQIHKGADHLEITAVARKLGRTLQSSEDATGVAAMYRAGAGAGNAATDTQGNGQSGPRTNTRQLAVVSGVRRVALNRLRGTRLGERCCEPLLLNLAPGPNMCPRRLHLF